MDHLIRRLLTVLAIGALWAITWPIMGMAVMAVLTIALGPNGDIGPVEMAVILGRVGLPAGIVFGALVAILEPRRAMADLAPVRFLTYGVIAASLTGVVAGLQPSAIVQACVLGVVSAGATIAIARVSQVGRPLRA